MRQVAQRKMLCFAAMVLVAAGSAPTQSHAQDTNVIELTQTGCQFLEPEQGYDHGFKTKQSTDCVLINAETSVDRLAQVKPLVLKPGRYVFRVTNKNVPYQLGFYLRAAKRLMVPLKPKVVGGGVNIGDTKEFAIDLKPGSYLYSCPLNPTPDYPLIVKE